MAGKPNGKDESAQNGSILIEFQAPLSVIHTIHIGAGVQADQLIVVANRLRQLAELQIAAHLAQTMQQVAASKIAVPHVIPPRNLGELS